MVVFFTAPGGAEAMELLSQYPSFSSHLVFTDTPLAVVFDQSLLRSSVDELSFYVSDAGNTFAVAGAISFASTYQADDTAIFTPNGPWGFTARYRLHVTADVQSATGDPFTGALPFDGVFVANIPNDMQVPEYNPADPMAMFVDTNPLLGFNPVDPEADAQPWQIPGMNITGAWKYTTGSPEVIVALLDDGIDNYTDPELRKAFFINAGELPLPNVDGEPCDDYDCNHDGRFDVDDYANDDRVMGTPPYSAYDLIVSFSNGVDEDGNGLADDISGWDFWRGANDSIGTYALPSGDHGHFIANSIANAADNGIGAWPGICPQCRILPIRASASLIYDYGHLSAAARYAAAMGASAMNFAGVNLTWSAAGHQAFIDAFEGGALTSAVSGDEMLFHHWMPSSGEEIMGMKSIFAMVPVELGGLFDLQSIGFTESFCTNYGTHALLSVPAFDGCTSGGSANLSGAVGLLVARGRELGLNLTADEIKQLLTMTATDIQSHCLTINSLFGECQAGFDEHFGYGRPDIETALRALGDPDFGLAPAIPPSVRITSPQWWQTLDPKAQPHLDVYGKISSRSAAYEWRIQLAPGYEPLESEFQTVAEGSEIAPLDGLIATVDVADFFPEEWATGVPENQHTFEATLRMQASYETKDGAVTGEARKTISVHIDDNPQTGLVPGFPLYLAASGESSPVLYDLDGAADQRLEIIMGQGDGTVIALKYISAGRTWHNLAGFPVNLAGADEYVKDSIFASVAVGDLFGDGTAEIVAATLNGKVYAIDPVAAAEGLPLLDGFPVSADAPDPSTALTYGYGNGFLGAPVLVDLDRDGMLEIVAASSDQKVYAWKPKGAGQAAEALPGWPVVIKSIEGLVDPDKVCESNGPRPTLATPAAGIIDPSSSDPQIRDYPVVIAPSNETCTNDFSPKTRVYAIFHDGNQHAGGPFLPGWPVMPLAPFGPAIPIPHMVGSSASPAVLVRPDDTVIAIGSPGWYPLMIHYRHGRARLEQFGSGLTLNAISSPIISALSGGDEMHFVLPVINAIRFNELGFQLYNPKVAAWRLDEPHTQIFEAPVEDIPMLASSSVADLDNDGRREILSGTGGYLLHAFTMDGGEAPDWPKFTQKWNMAVPTAGDFDADGKLEVVAPTREGWLYAWEAEGAECVDGRPNSDWPRFHHDERNTGIYGLDVTPPGRIVDLAAVHRAGDDIVLTFSAPGDDWRCGRAHKYDIRYSTAATADLSDPAQFAAATPVENKFPPLAGQTIETLLIQAPGAKHVAIQTQDHAGHLSMISIDAPVTEADDDVSDDDTADDDAADDDAANDDASDDEAAPTADDDQAGDDDDDDGCGC